MSVSTEPGPKKLKKDNTTATAPEKTCKFFLIRKKRLCKMTVGRDKDYCGEHEVILYKRENSDVVDPDAKRIPCPLDPKHSIDSSKLDKHLKICNARPKELPRYLKLGMNIMDENCKHQLEKSSVTALKLSQVDCNLLKTVVDKTKTLYEKYLIGTLEEMILEHEVLKEDINDAQYGARSLKHLIQNSSILGCMEHMGFIKTKSQFIEFGCGKGQVSYCLAKAIKDLEHKAIFLIDKEAHRHKQDNRIDKDVITVQRIRANIADLDLCELAKTTTGNFRTIAVSKHLCGAATDLTLRCIVNGNAKSSAVMQSLTEGLIIAVCCHHRCTWQTFVGKDFLIENNINREEFEVMTKICGWAICGSGMSREKRKQLSEVTEAETKEQIDEVTDEEMNVPVKMDRVEREKIGLYCKRIFDYARMQYLDTNNFKCNLKYYTKSDITLENVILIAELKK